MMMRTLMTMLEVMEEEWKDMVEKVDNLMITVNKTTIKMKNMEQDIHNAVNDAISNMANCPDIDQKIAELETQQTNTNDEIYNLQQSLTYNEDDMTKIKNGLRLLVAELME